MNRRRFLLQAVVAGAGIVGALPAIAQGVPRTRPERPYRDDLLTDSERSNFQQGMRNARTDRERESLRREYRTKADERSTISTNQNIPPYRAPAGGWPNSAAGKTTGQVGVPGAPIVGNPGGAPVR